MANVGRNSPCQCGSGRKHKHCCGSLERPGSARKNSEVDLGIRYLTGRDVRPDPARGVTLVEKAADAGDAEGAWLAATVASTDLWRKRDWDRALNYLVRAAERGHGAAQSSLRILAGGPGGDHVEGGDWAAMRASINLDAWLAPSAPEALRETPRIETVAKFAPPAACDWLLMQARDRLSRATIYDKVTGGSTEDNRRTNSQCDLDIQNLGVLTFMLRARIGAITGRRERAMEIPKVLHYSPGETFAEHFDYLDPSEPAYAAELAARGQRTHTFLIYLNDDFEGGETQFPLIGISHKGAKGDGLLFANTDADGRPDKDTMHTGLPPTSGEKWVFSQWIREFPRL